MAESASITFRIPDELLEEIDALGRERFPRSEGVKNAKIPYDRTACLLELVRLGLEALGRDSHATPNKGVAIEDFEKLRQQVEEMAERLGKLRA